MDIACGKACTVSLWETWFGLWLAMLCHCVSWFRSCMLSRTRSSRVDLLRNELCHEREVRVLIIIGVSIVIDDELGLPIVIYYFLNVLQMAI